MPWIYLGKNFHIIFFIFDLFLISSKFSHFYNNHLQRSLAKSNFPWYGIDFGNGLPTGRYTNGRTICDIAGISYFPHPQFNLWIFMCYILGTFEVFIWSGVVANMCFLCGLGVSKHCSPQLMRKLFGENCWTVLCVLINNDRFAEETLREISVIRLSYS